MEAMRIASNHCKPLPRKIAFTVTALSALTPPASGRTWVYDSKTPGLAFCITENNARAYYLVRRINGRPNRIRIAGVEVPIDQIRKMAGKMLGDVAQGIDPAAKKRAFRQSSTLQELFDRWVEDHAKPRLAARTLETDKSRFDTCLADLASRKITSITAEDVRGIHSKIGRERGDVTANRAVQLLRKLYNFAGAAVNPASKTVKLFREESRTRFIQPAEMPKLFAALDDEKTNPMIRDFLYTALFTGARRSNVASMRDDEIDVKAAIWTIPSTKTKGKKEIRIPLVPQALTIIKRRLSHESGFIFPSHGRAGHLVEPKKTWENVLARAGLKDLRVHDLRRSMGSYQAVLGSSLPVIGASLGHGNLAATQIYSRLYLDPVRDSVRLAADAMSKAGAMKRKTKHREKN